MATGDIKNNLRKLQNELKLIQYVNEVDFEKMLIGLSAPFLPILHYVFAEYSCDLSSYFSSKGYDLYAKSDFRFLEIIYKILIQEFETKPMLTKQQFFSIGYPEVKVIFTSKIVSLCRQKHEGIAKKIGKKKKKNALAMKPSQNRQVTDTNEEHTTNNMQLGGMMVQGCTEVIEDKINKNDNMCIIPQNITPPEYHIKPPKPNPELALSPVKSVNDEAMSGSYEGVRRDEDKEIDSRLLDLTDIGEESFVETGVVEIIDVDDEKSIGLPEFKITKHYTDEKILNMNADDWSVHQPHINKQFSDGHSLPGNVSVASPQCRKSSKQNTRCQQCQQCVINSDVIGILFQKVEAMEHNILNLTTVNNDLSAKVVLMETKLKIMENNDHRDKETNDDGNVNAVLHQNEYLNNVSNAYSQYDDLNDANSGFNTGKDVCKISVPSENSGVSSMVTIGSKPTNPEKSYSPIKYTDDDVIIKDFKPIRMKDVHDMMNEVNLYDNKENEGIHSRIKNVKVRKEPFSVKVVDDTHTDGTNVDHCEEYDMFVDSCNVSKLEDDFTEQAVRNVRRKLQETEDMLKSSGNYTMK